MEKILTSKEIFALEEKAIQSGISITSLMERAGTSVYEEVIKYYKPCKILVLCGPGNNGGDGFVVARLLKNNGWKVKVASDTSIDIKKLSEASAINRAKWQDKIIDFKDLNLDNYDLIIDALFGIGLHKEVRGIYKKIIKATNGKKIISIDIPSGIDSDTGKILGCTIQAVLTITFEYKKPAFILPDPQRYFGKIIIKNIGLI
ncbi:MAG: NAD(P)H-hydrate epimerase [Rickettsiales bacterium]|nr:NAD(P)H-hydrate epimerase [Rickettsiales bacterium]